MPNGHVKEILNGPVVIHAELRYPIGVNHRMNGGKPFVTLCQVTYRAGMVEVPIPANFYFDGASIPRAFWVVRGFCPLDQSILAALFHDYCCDNPKVVRERIISDAVFYAILKHLPVSGRFQVIKKIARAVRAWMMWKAVRMWSTWRAVQHRAGAEWLCAHRLLGFGSSSRKRKK